jgi:hypothetical protein
MAIRFNRKTTGTGAPVSLLYGQPAIDTDGNLYIGDPSGVPVQIAQRGSFLTVADDTTRDAIPAAFRRQGMVVSVDSSAGNGGNPTLYRLEGGIANINWINLTTSFHAELHDLDSGLDHGVGLLTENRLPVVGDATTPLKDSQIEFDPTTGATKFLTREQSKQGADVVSTADLVLGNDGNVFVITGSTQITAIGTAGWQDGSSVELFFSGSPTIKHNTSGGVGTAVIKLNGEADMSASIGAILKLRKISGEWKEVSRSFTGA